MSSAADMGITVAIVREFADLHKRLGAEIDGLDDTALNRAPRAGQNSIGVLVWHALGAQRHMLRKAAGTPSERDRDAEFRAVPTSGALAALIAEAERVAPELVRTALQRAEGPGRGSGASGERSVDELIVHALAHTGEHLGHAELTRKLVQG